MSVKLYQWLAMLFLVVMAGCYPKGAEYIEELDLVYTNYYNQFDFQGQTTYAIPDSVVKITGDVFNDSDGNGKPQFMTAANSKIILDQVKKNMADFGWTLVDRRNNPDVILLVSSMTTTNIYYYYDWYYWDWWYGGYYGWYYPGWYYPPYVTGYRSGSVLTQMIVPKGVPQGENVPVVWNSILNGLAEGSSSELAARVQRGIDQAFAQSPYLRQ
jgi:hypothetical protein